MIHCYALSTLSNSYICLTASLLTVHVSQLQLKERLAQRTFFTLRSPLRLHLRISMASYQVFIYLTRLDLSTNNVTAQYNSGLQDSIIDVPERGVYKVSLDSR